MYVCMHVYVQNGMEVRKPRRSNMAWLEDRQICFSIPQRMNCNLNDLKGLIHPSNYILFNVFLESGRSSTKIEIKRFLCSRFRALCLWSIFLSLWVHNFILIYKERH